MVDQAGLLPPGFEALEPFVERWAAQSTSERAARRVQSSDIERKAFYEAGKALAKDALDFLDQKPMSHFDARETCLMEIMLSLAHASLALEVQKESEPVHGQASLHLRYIERSDR